MTANDCGFGVRHRLLLNLVFSRLASLLNRATVHSPICVVPLKQCACSCVHPLPHSLSCSKCVWNLFSISILSTSLQLQLQFISVVINPLLLLLLLLVLFLPLLQQLDVSFCCIVFWLKLLNWRTDHTILVRRAWPQ